MKSLKTLGLLAFALLAAHCSPANTTVSCTTTTSIMNGGTTSSSATCSEHPTDDVEGARAGCMVTSDGGSSGDAGTSITTTDMFTAGPCSHTGAVGGCQTGDSAMWFYAGWTADSIRSQCAANGGTFLTP